MLDTTKTAIAHRVKTLIADYITPYPSDAAHIRDDLELALDLGVDSMDCVALALAVEQEFEIEVMDGDIKSFDTVGDLIEFVIAELAEQKREVMA